MNYWQGRQTHKNGNSVVEDALPAPALRPALAAKNAKWLFDAACNLIYQAKTTPDKDLVVKWFGDRAQLVEDVEPKVEQTHTFLQNNILQVRFALRKENLGAYDRDFHIPNVAQLGKGILYTRYSWGEKVMTLLHEMSHVILGTLDIGADSKTQTYEGMGACYGPWALKLAKNSLKDPLWGSFGREKAIMNAENWGYYFLSYWTKIPDAERLDKLSLPLEFTNLDDKKLKDVTTYKADRPAAGILDMRITEQ
jgi:hypothetical protein